MTVEAIELLYRRLDEGRGDIGRTLLEIAQHHVDAGDGSGALEVLKRLALSDRNYRQWNGASRLIGKLPPELPQVSDPSVSVALLGTSTLDQLGALLPVAGLAADLRLELYTAGFGQYEAEVLDPSSSLRRFDPDVIVLAPDAGAVVFPPVAEDADQRVGYELSRWTGVWGAIRERSRARVLQLNFVPPYPRPLGTLDGVRPGSRRTMFELLNRRMAEAAAAEAISIVDTCAVASAYGLERWYDDRYWFHAKQAVALGALPRLATEIAAVLRGSLGRARKVLVTDLDNTLWGGVVGDDGVEGLQLSGTAVGEAHLAVQQYLYDLKQRGVLLAVSSKNEDAAARAPFLERDDMVLSIQDFAGFLASWSPKPEAIRSLAEQLDLGLDAFVFLDDNPAERAAVRQQLPEVDVIDLPEDASRYLRALADYRGFDVASVTQEDLARTDQYRARAAAAELRQDAGSLEEFLESLDMVALIRPLDDLTLPRVAQLIGKTNQWNLTARRHSFEELQRFAQDPDATAFSLQLTDRFADHGIVAVAIALRDDETLDVDTLLMSCRVIGRTVERTILDELVRQAEKRGLRRIRGNYHRTAKNGLVEELYRDLGFEQLERDEHGSTWALGLDNRLHDENLAIRLDTTP